MIFSTKNFVFFLDNFPIIKGHSLLAPKNHIRKESKIPKDQWSEYIELSNKAYQYIKKKYSRYPLVFINAPQDQSVKHFHKHFIPGYFGYLGVSKALTNFLKENKNV
ncbi:hypothetical protein A2954_06880 [Candidatus Roizmanbacteria bacterium RIFCSPLOWO2_01_FULL_37_12]|uniref:HIT domain-containing protein n=1 Tax=Candidatus Roizmanbacteria bacterium RIFCSPLOWO2_01_FULL_37_12 TaxID=1802056 RepID=A0A1F7ID78_9BACT|nr:MAG: hypothetical protein A3D76_03130 [Candidatus Roizmanbacteria bacterium RIFCSPHIGHO2_02_FULL_37_9b]OGK41315.1 MAG: hypothetical protein A2954_06880 [Candidatus Roizmanbacteria bacterium RIFCSPLOWO2_01_FULL_37_12]